MGFLRLWSLVPIRTVLGTGAVLLGSVVAVASVRNFTGLVLGISAPVVKILDSQHLVLHFGRCYCNDVLLDGCRVDSNDN